MSRRTIAALLLVAALLGLVGWLVFRGETVETARGEPASSTEASSGRLPAPDSTPDGEAGAPDPSAAGSMPPPVIPTGWAGGLPPGEPPRRSIADILEQADLSDPAQRERAVAEIAALEDRIRQAGLARARELGLPLRVERPDGTVKEVAGLDDSGEVLYFITHNVNAAISTAADVLRTQYGLNGSGLVIGMWDGGAGRSTHREFATGRMVIKDGSTPIDHATHVGGTMIASGVTASARGMAVAATVDSYDWNNDKSEMTAVGASAPGQAGKILLSNHSYGFISGWYRTGGSSPAFIWYGSGTTATSVDPRFGQYNTQARDSDSLAFSAPYYLMFRSAGNDRTDNPSNGQSVQLSPSSTTTVAYDSSLHPGGDGTYRGGYDLIGFDAVAKNVVTIGSVTDAVNNGQRDISRANQSSFSSWGPTDDGRIKPDLVANGDGVYSTLAGGDSSYGTFSGTSMSAPNATGTAALLTEEYARLFNGGVMRASTLKALLIHTADDRGNPGPDYQFGWGLINGKAAADLIRDHAQNPVKLRMTEKRLPAGQTITEQIVWDGVSPIRVTLVWTDPAGTASTATDSRTPVLRNNLDVRVIAPDGTQFFPYVMPFVGTWTVASMSQPATTGINNTDNVEQVYIASPPEAGVYRVVVSHQGSLVNNQQDYSLLISGSAAEEPPPPPLALEAIAPTSALAGAVRAIEVTGVSLASVQDLRLRRSGQPDLTAFNLQLVGEKLAAQVDLTGAASGAWDVVASNGSETSTLSGAFTVIGSLFVEDFDAAGFTVQVTSSPGTLWASTASVGSNSWGLTTAHFHSAPRSVFAAAPATKTTTRLTSPAIAVPANASNLQLRFWHRYNTQANQDGGRLEISIDGGTWFGVDDDNSGVSFASNGYNSTIASTGNPNSRSEFAGRRAWSGNSGGFIETVLNLNDTAKFAGKTVRFRWTLATNASRASEGWYVDTVSLLGGGDLANKPPSITTAAAVPGVTPVVEEDVEVFRVSGVTAPLTVAATDDGGSGNLTYTWSASGPAPVFFLATGTNAASTTEANFEALGDYSIVVTVTDSGGLSATSSLLVRVLPEAASISIMPSSASLPFGSSVSFAATLLDQFGNPMAQQPAFFNWSATGGGVIDEVGVFMATQPGENYAVVASTGSLTSLATFGQDLPAVTSGDVSEFAQVTVTRAAATLELDNLEQVYDGTPRPVVVRTSPEDLAVLVTYDGVETTPSDAGTYEVVAEIADERYFGRAEGTLVVARAAQSITFDALPAKTFGDEPFSAGGTATSGLAVFYESSNTGVATISGDTITVVGAGTANITATQGGDSNYEAAAPVVQTLNVAAAPAAVSLGNLTQTYDGESKVVTVTTEPAGLEVVVTYDGSDGAPVNAGSYAVVATVTDPNYTGSASGTLEIVRAAQSITFGALPAKTFGDAPFSAGASASSGLAVAYTSSNPSVAVVDDAGQITIAGAGTSTITAAQAGDDNHEAAVSVNQTLTVSKAGVVVFLDGLSAVYDGTAQAVTVTTAPEGLAVSLTYNGSADAPVDAGSYQVEAVVDDLNYEGSASGTLMIAKAEATVVIGNLSQVFDGEPKEVSVETSPAGLPVTVSYNESTNAPSVAGVYEVVATVDDANYQGEARATLIIEEAADELTFEKWQEDNFGENAAQNPDAAPTADPDGDGASNLAEFYLGTDPRDPASRLSLMTDVPSGGTMAVTIAPVTRTGTFRLQTWTSLLEPPESEDLEISEEEERAGFAGRDIDLSDGEGQILDKIFLRIIYEPPAL